jgi:hypothetical protein
MRQSNTTAKAIDLRHFFLYSFVLILSFSFIMSKAHASGSKMPEVSSDADGTSAAPNSNPAYAHIDPDHEVPSALLNKALNYFDSHQSQIKNKEVIGVIDFSQHSSKERFYIIDMSSGKVDRYQAAHGKNSDTDNDGYATQFSNEANSEMSSRGFYMTAETYSGEHGYSLRLDGLSSTNSNARARAVVIHPADYVSSGQQAGRSWGCPAMDPRYSEEVINQIKGGALIYAQ